MEIILKDDERIIEKWKVLNEYPQADQTSPLTDELADCTAAKINEAINGLKRKDYSGSRGSFDDLKIAIESLSGGANTVLLDDTEMPSIMVGLPKMRISDLYGGNNNSIHPAWIMDGTIKEVIYISKFMNTMVNGRAYSLPMKDPYTFFDFDDANEFCQNKGKGWHLMTNAAWAAIAAWSKRNNTIPRGNTSTGYAWDAPHEKGIPTAMNGYEVLRTASGSGPVTWNHNHNPSGIADLVGNMFEWVGGLRLLNGEIQIIPQATAMMHGKEAYAKESHRWRAITTKGDYAAHGERDTYKVDSLFVGDSEERDHAIGAPVISTEITNRAYLGEDVTGNQAYVECRFSDLKTQSGLCTPEQLKQLAILPDEFCTKEDGIFVARNYGERIAVRGGKAGSCDRAGLNALHFYNPRFYDGSATIGFRSGYVEL